MPEKRFNILLILFILSSLLPQLAYTQPILVTPEYLSFIQQKINPFLIYPLEAKTKGWEGIVKVEFTIGPDGRIKEIDIAESSGYPLLDAAAILAIKDASPYPFPKEYAKKELEIVLPVNYEQPKPPPVKKALILPEEVKTNPVVPISRPQELSAFIELALKNNQPTQVARQEIQYAQFKVVEAKRSLLPALKILRYNTEGDVYRIDYEEEENKFQIDQPLFYAGRLGDTIKQARVNLEITQKNYDRLTLDVIQKTETAYYNLIAAKMHLGLKEPLQQEAKEILEKIEKLSQAGLATPLEVSSAASWFEQIELQVNSIKQDLFMAELTFKQVLNIKETPQVQAQLLETKTLDLDLDKCVDVALQKRPEIYLSELLVKFHDYGQKIESKKNNRPTVDLTGSYGFYKGHYLTEPERDSKNWYVGVKASMPWGANTINSSYTSEKTQPRFGQTSPTASSTMSAEFNLLDNLKRLSDKKKANVDLTSALSDFNETFKTITFEVQDAFLKYQKAFLQLKAAEAEMRFRRNEAEVTQVRAMVGEISLSQTMESLYSLSEAQTKFIQALANYQISLANLKKASGYGLQI